MPIQRWKVTSEALRAHRNSAGSSGFSLPTVFSLANVLIGWPAPPRGARVCRYFCSRLGELPPTGKTHPRPHRAPRHGCNKGEKDSWQKWRCYNYVTKFPGKKTAPPHSQRNRLLASHSSRQAAGVSGQRAWGRRWFNQSFLQLCCI